MDSYKYSQFIKGNQETRWATVEEIKNSGTYIDVSQPTCPAGGLPLRSEAPSEQGLDFCHNCLDCPESVH